MNTRLSFQRLLGRFIAGAAGAVALTGTILAVSLAATTAAAQTIPPIDAVASVGLTVGDLDKEIAFFAGVLPFEKVAESEAAGESVERLSGVFGARCRTARLRLGEEQIELTQFLAPEGRQIPIDSRSNDRWFQHLAIVVSDMDKAYAHLRDHNIRHASTGPQTLPAWNPNAGGISAFYFKDPESHILEIIHFPAGKGDPRWQGVSDRLFLGIDHTAIVVADTDRSLSFYQGTLGMRVAGSAENYGTEQEHLNNVFGARLRITALKAAHGPGVELLEYLAPVDGRPYPTDSHANDLWSWRTTLITPVPTDLEGRLRTAHAAWVSPGLVPVAGGFACQVRDPDGHAMVIRSVPAARAHAVP